ncbi:hypothetical protein BBJ28_00019893 [Nothophytophthora sp. Chile5]|nr:hypothetical protein BBJ28_00019893 [Nothophytophthora sp. Chile5]
MLLGRGPSGPRRSVLSSHEYDKETRGGGRSLGRRLARFLRRSSAVSVADEPSPRHSMVARSSVSAVSTNMDSVRASAGIGAVDPEICFAAADPRGFAVRTRRGVRAVNEDRYRVIDNLELYGRALLAVAPRHVSPFYADLLRARVLESFVVDGRAPALRVRHILRDRADVRADTQFFGVYDGHGGARASSLLALLLPLHLLAAPEFSSDLAAACQSASLALDAEIRTREAAGQCEGGATALTLLLRGRTALLSNTGDCRAVLVAKGGDRAVGTQLTTDHKATNADEKERVERAGGLILYVKGVARVDGRLAVTRAFGDAELRPHVIADPEVTTLELQRGDEYIVLASDGLWDAMTSDQVAAAIR